jgi:hypothetical protein
MECVWFLQLHATGFGSNHRDLFWCAWAGDSDVLEDLIHGAVSLTAADAYGFES